MLDIKNLSCGYDNIDVIKDFNLSVKAKEKICIAGPNGCGKTTLLKAIIGLLDFNGNILIEGKDLKDYSKKDLAKKIALLAQNSAVYFPYSVYDTVSLGRYAHISDPLGRLSKYDEEYVLSCIESVGLIDIKDKLISDLSGGQLQRVYLARTFAQEPKIILLDEPTNHLDLKSQIELFQHIDNWVKGEDRVVIGVLHDLNSVQNFADRVILLKDGEVVSSGDTKRVLSEENLIATYNTNVRRYMLNSLKKWE